MPLPEGFVPIDAPEDRRLDVVFLGAGAFGGPTLRALAERHNVRAVVTQPDRPAGRGRKVTPSEIAALADEVLPGVPVFKPEDINEPEAMDRVRAVPSHAWVVIAYGQKLSPGLIAGKNAMNLHGSRLPRWRGAAPIHHAVMAGDEITGNTVITIADRMDAGLVLGMSERPIRDDQTTDELHDLLASDGPALVLGVLDRLQRGTLTGEPQDESLVTRARKLGADDRPVRWDRPPELVARQINGLSPWPGAAAWLGDRPVKLLRARPEAAGADSEEMTGTRGDGSAPPGTVVDWTLGRIATGDGFVRLLEIQAPGKPRMSWDAFARGHEAPASPRLGPEPGSTLESRAS